MRLTFARVGDPPYNHVTTFAKGKVSSKNLTCVEDEAGASTCTQHPIAKKLNLPIYAAIA
jgi:hypothetical protein